MAEATLHKLATHQNNTHDQTHLKARATNSSSREMETAMAWHGMAWRAQASPWLKRSKLLAVSLISPTYMKTKHVFG